MKKAFLAGINAYPGSPLKGCVNDVASMYDLLTKKFAFKPDDVRVLVDGRATTQAMKERLDWLVTGLKPGDVAVFHYSGHGSQIRDRGPLDELADFKDEILCPVDLDWAQKMIVDDDLAEYLKRVPAGAFMYVVLDCCHSGTGTRDLQPPGEDGGNPHPEKYRKGRFLAPPFDVEARSLDRDLPVQKIGKAAPLVGTTRVVRSASCCCTKRSWWSFWKPKPKPPVPVKVTATPEMNHVLISGCRSDQTSADAYLAGRYCGALTANLAKVISENPTKTVAEIGVATQAAVKSGGFEQVPQIEGPANLLSRPIFT